jgi:hypothetical protein
LFSQVFDSNKIRLSRDIGKCLAWFSARPLGNAQAARDLQQSRGDEIAASVRRSIEKVG